MQSSIVTIFHWPWLILVGAAFTIWITAYVIYYRWLHPLAGYPGPFWASITNFWKSYQIFTLHMPETLVALHEQYGEVVRVGPNDLSFRSGNASTLIYKGGRSLPKTKFYDGFTAFNPNLFGTQDEEIHALRRRQMAHTFSLQSIKDMEPFIDRHIRFLRHNLDQAAESRDVVNLKELIAYYVLDVLGDLAFSKSFDSQRTQSLAELPPINDHIFLACLLGQTPELLPYLKTLSANTPLPWFRRLFAARAKLRNLTASCVRSRLNEKSVDRKDLLGCLIDAVDPETGSKLTELDINTEAFAMIVAGSHTTSGTLTLLFAHLLQNPSILGKVQRELDQELPAEVETAYPVKDLEQKLSYTMACIQENFRINPVFTMPLPRKVTATEGMKIDEHFVPRGTTIFSLNHVVHHSPEIWGSTHELYDPERFLGPEADFYKRNLFPFSTGHRMCIGRNMAMTNILKVVTTVLKHYEIEMAEPERKIRTLSVGISEKEGPLLVRVQRRNVGRKSV